jgi:hypothetical protein
VARRGPGGAISTPPVRSSHSIRLIAFDLQPEAPAEALLPRPPLISAQ